MNTKLLSKLTIGSIAAAGLLAGAGAANAASFTYDMTNVTLSDGGTITGSFDYEDTGIFSNWNITTGAGNAITSPFTYDTGSASEGSGNDADTFNLDANNGERFLFFDFAASLGSPTAVGQTITLNLSNPPLFSQPTNEVNFIPGQGSQFRGVTGGVVTVTAFDPGIIDPPDPGTSTPEPSALLGLITLGGLGALAKGKKS